jgi:hypothetical protein
MKLVTATIGVILALATFAHAAAWVPASGNNATINHSNGQDVSGHFGNPEIGEAKFVFANPSAFTAVSPGPPTLTTDTTSVNVTAVAGQTITSVSATVRGDYTFNDSPAELDYSAKLTVDYGSGPVAVDLVFVPPSPLITGEGQFSGTATLTLPANVTSLSSSLFASIQADSSGSATTFIQIKSADLVFTTVPEPTSLTLIGGAGLFILGRRRR